IVKASVSGQKLILAAGTSSGTAVFSVRATDSGGGFVESQFVVTVGEAVLLFNDGFETGVLQDHWRVVRNRGELNVASVGFEGARSLQFSGNIPWGIQNLIVELDISSWNGVVVE
ncbi:MAG: hypothetical protein ACK6EB_21145, partial [Planctomyces sp.]